MESDFLIPIIKIRGCKNVKKIVGPGLQRFILIISISVKLK